MVVISKSPDDVNRGEGKMMMFMTVLVMTTMLAQEEEETNSQLANSIRKQEQVKEDDNIADLLEMSDKILFLMTL